MQEVLNSRGAVIGHRADDGHNPQVFAPVPAADGQILPDAIFNRFSLGR